LTTRRVSCTIPGVLRPATNMILADENIPHAEELFGRLGEVKLVHGREIGPDFPGLERAEVLAIRSVTKITPELVDRARTLRVVATATIGTDHIDTAYIDEINICREAPISVVSAPGSNADSVADYVFYAIGHLTQRRREPLRGRSMGIVGFGNCGSRVGRRAGAFGMEVRKHDPPLAAKRPDFPSDPIEAALSCDFVTLHVPLTTAEESRHPTLRMIGGGELALMRGGAHLFNTSRGLTVNSNDLIAALKERRLAGAFLDVYEGEPEPDRDLVLLPLLSTPHVAGYAVEGKLRGAIMIYERVCRALGIQPDDTRPLVQSELPEGSRSAVSFDAAAPVAVAADNAVRALMKTTYDISGTSAALKATLSGDAACERGRAFDELRREYARGARHEMSVWRVKLGDGIKDPLADEIAQRLAGFGTELSEHDPHYILSPE